MMLARLHPSCYPSLLPLPPALAPSPPPPATCRQTVASASEAASAHPTHRRRATSRAPPRPGCAAVDGKL
eukprot:5362904-Pleurochrysis_carterae.AAC.1